MDTEFISVVKEKFANYFPEASSACTSPNQRESIPALAMYAAFKKGYEIGRDEIVQQVIARKQRSQ